MLLENTSFPFYWRADRMQDGPDKYICEYVSGVIFCEIHDDVIKWKHFPRYWPFVRGIHRSPVNSSHKGQWCGALMFSLICVWINGSVNNREAGDLRRYYAHYDVTLMSTTKLWLLLLIMIDIMGLNLWSSYWILECNYTLWAQWLVTWTNDD